MNNFNQDQQYADYQVVGSTVRPVAKTFMASVFLWMFAALGLSAFFSLWFANSPELMSSVFDGRNFTGLGTLARFAPLGFVLLMSFGYNKLSAPVMTFLFLTFAAIMGISLSVWLVVFTTSSVFGCFLSASVMFGIMAVLGYTTKQDLTSFGRILMMGLIGIIIASIVNMFLGSAFMDYIISFIGVAVFTGLTAYDVQKLKQIGAGAYGIGENETRKLAIFGALSLYLDFINLFLMLLRLFGKRRS